MTVWTPTVQTHHLKAWSNSYFLNKQDFSALQYTVYTYCIYLWQGCCEPHKRINVTLRSWAFKSDRLGVVSSWSRLMGWGGADRKRPVSPQEPAKHKRSFQGGSEKTFTLNMDEFWAWRTHTHAHTHTKQKTRTGTKSYSHLESTTCHSITQTLII